MTQALYRTLARPEEFPSIAPAFESSIYKCWDADEQAEKGEPYLMSSQMQLKDFINWISTFFFLLFHSYLQSDLVSRHRWDPSNPFSIVGYLDWLRVYSRSIGQIPRSRSGRCKSLFARRQRSIPTSVRVDGGWYSYYCQIYWVGHDQEEVKGRQSERRRVCQTY